MKRLNKTEKIAFNQRHPVKKTKFYQVIHCGKVVLENNDYTFCRLFIARHNLKNATIQAVK